MLQAGSLPVEEVFQRMAEDFVTMNTFYRDFFIFCQNPTLEKRASSTNTHICCRRACSSTTLPFFVYQMKVTLLVCKAAAPKKEPVPG